MVKGQAWALGRTRVRLSKSCPLAGKGLRTHRQSWLRHGGLRDIGVLMDTLEELGSPSFLTFPSPLLSKASGRRHSAVNGQCLFNLCRFLLHWKERGALRT